MNDLANSNMTQNSQPVRIDFNTPELQRKRRMRALKDRLTRWYVLVGGLAVLAAITLIFFYLAYVVLPLFQGAELTSKKALEPTWLQQDAGKPLMIALEEQNQVGMRVSDKGQALFFDTKTGNELKRVELPVPQTPRSRPSVLTSRAARWWCWACPMARRWFSSTPTRSPTRTTRKPSALASTTRTASNRSCSTSRGVRWTTSASTSMATPCCLPALPVLICRWSS